MYLLLGSQYIGYLLTHLPSINITFYFHQKAFQFTLEQHRFELHESTYIWILFNKYVLSAVGWSPDAELWIRKAGPWEFEHLCDCGVCIGSWNHPHRHQGQLHSPSGWNPCISRMRSCVAEQKFLRMIINDDKGSAVTFYMGLCLLNKFKAHSRMPGFREATCMKEGMVA